MIEGCEFGMLYVDDVQVPQKYISPFDSLNGFEGIDYAGRDDEFLDQLYYVDDGSVTSI